ncbi:MAG TPA: L-threonylcarbamoyladenylate synthase [Acidimicrobiales bacterium]|nr:L-threonylcarbamoyladenylate synthase [Acidimicrobiales bacterium]
MGGARRGPAGGPPAVRLRHQCRARGEHAARLPASSLSSDTPAARPPLVAADAEGVTRALQILGRGEVIGTPTDTVYGLAVVPGIAGAVDRLFVAKGRPASVPVAVLVADLDQAQALCDAPLPRPLVERHWPGPLTLVVRRRAGLDWDLGGNPHTIGLRWPDHALVRELCSSAGPLATTSANLHGNPSPTQAAGVAEEMAGAPVTLVLDGGECAGRPSTVVDLTGDIPVVLREGALGESDLLL